MKMKKTVLTVLVMAAMAFVLNSCSGKKDGNNAINGEAADSLTSNSELGTFDYSPTEPQNGKKKAVVELGASGFNLFIITVDENKNWKKEKAEFGQSGVAEGATNVDEVKGDLQDYIKSILAEGVDGKEIHFVVSSGAAKEPIVETINTALKAIGYTVNTVTPEQEALYAFKCVLPKEYEGSAFVVDLGSGNTKVSWKQGVGEKPKTLETFGAKYFQKGFDDATVSEDVKNKLADVPEANTKTLFIIGGVPFKMASELKKGSERYTVLSKNVADYDKIAQDDEKNKAGLNIYKAIIDTTNAGQVVFDWDANFTIGFLLSLPY